MENRMVRSRKQNSKSIPKAYAELVRLFPLQPLRDEVKYDHALWMAGALVGSINLSKDQAAYLDVLTDMIQEYESLRHCIDEPTAASHPKSNQSHPAPKRIAARESGRRSPRPIRANAPPNKPRRKSRSFGR